nr:hypothetical protein [Tanacetum cinerariifolium]
MFDEYFNPPTIAVSPVQEAAAAQRALVLADSIVLTSIDQDAPSTSIPSTEEQENSLNIYHGFKESPKHQFFVMIHFMNLLLKTQLIKDHHRIITKTPIFCDDPLHESLIEDLTYQGSSSNVRQTDAPFKHLGRWTKDHPIANVINDPSRSVSIRKQLQTDAI